MKHCPQCKRTFSEDNLFCLEDGSPLRHYADPAGQSFSGDMPTVVIPSSGQNLSPSVPVQRQTNWLYLVVGMLAILVIVMGFLLFYKFASSEKQAENVSAAVNNESTGKQTPTSTPAAISSLAAISTPVQTPLRPAYLPPQSRVRFGKGKVTANVTGLVPPGANRSLVLACRPGQYLSASVSSPGGCVTFTGGMASTEGYTVQGDNYLYIRNNCGTDGSFNMSIFIK